MRVGIDIRPLQGETRFRGIGKTLEFFMLALNRLPEKNSYNFVFYIEENEIKPEVLSNFPTSELHAIHSPKIGRKRYFRSFLPSYKAPRPNPKDVDVFLQFDAALGIPETVPSVVIFYDLIPLLFRTQEKNQARDASLYRRQKDRLAGNLYWQKYLRFIRSFERASSLVAISECSKKDLVTHFPAIDPDSVSVVPLGVDGSFFAAPQKPSSRIVKLAKDPYLLYVGGIDTRKNIIELVRILYALKPTHPKLKLLTVGKEFSLTDQMGDRGWFKEIDKNKAYAKDIINVGFVSHDDLLYLYGHAACFVFPSKYEGFGLPVLEAMAAGCPVVAFNTSSIPEVASNACILVEQDGDMTSAVKQLLEDGSLCAKYSKAGIKQAKKFSWASTAKQILAVADTYGKTE